MACVRPTISITSCSSRWTVQTGAQRVINANLGTIPQALQPIRGLTRLRDGGFLTSIARVRSDIYLIEGFRLPSPWWQRFWPFGRAPQR